VLVVNHRKTSSNFDRVGSANFVQSARQLESLMVAEILLIGFLTNCPCPAEPGGLSRALAGMRPSAAQDFAGTGLYSEL